MFTTKPTDSAAENSGRWIWLALLLSALALADGARLLYWKWASADPAVFEADTYTQGIHHALAGGSLWPWDLTGRFWHFLLIAPGIYLHIPALAAAPDGFVSLLLQAFAMAACGPLIYALARAGGAAGVHATALAAAWLLHPVVGVGFAWGWSPYASAAPLLLGGLLLLTRRRRSTGLLLLALAAVMKVNVALMTAGFGLWAVRHRRPEGRVVAVASVLWTGVTGSLFALALLSTGTLSQDIHLDGPEVMTAGGLWTVALALLPLLPLLTRSSAALVALSCGIELAYTLILNPANSGLLPAAAALFAAAALTLGQLSRPAPRLALAVGLALLGRQLYQPPRVSPLPLTPGAYTYALDPRGPVMRAWVEALPDGDTLLTIEPANGTVGTHPGLVVTPWEWDGGPAWVIIPEDHRGRWQDCTELLAPASSQGPAIYAGRCGAP